ncbi:ATP-grasp domain-containing protein [Tropicimonas marinistellae]|uniref:ATP-grasp domain-containing protein n=1 Tax=Tropicimonas marinistellae TaxID=1739787 RepID=UPI0008340AAF|nr:ATP-grasp domain-containing protein [Tropicimonas marinistellae]
MRLLVTNCRVAQAYATLRALRPHAEHVVATTSGKRPLGIWPTCHAAYSRLVDRRYEVPDPEGDWFHGRIGPYNTPKEEAFISAIEEICRAERIDTVFPTNDAWVYVFSKNKDRLASQGVVVPVPDFDVVKRPLDKYDTVQAAAETGFPHPRTVLAEDDASVRAAIADLPPPWVVKLRFTNGGRGMSFHWDSGELLKKTRELRETHGAPIVQEFIPGSETMSFYTVVDNEGRVISCQTPTNARARLSRPAHAGRSAFLTAPRHAFADHAAALAKHIGWWGSLTIQTMIDERDGIPKILEINPRLGVHLWLRTAVGVNEPLIALRLARGEKVDKVPEVPSGIVLLKPIEDTIAFGFDTFDYGSWKLRKLFGGTSVERHLAQDSLGELWDDYRGPYRRDGERRYSPYYDNFRSDPVPALIWTSKLLAANASLSVNRLFRPSSVKRPL